MKNFIILSSIFLSFLLIPSITKAGTVSIDSVDVFQPGGLCDLNQAARITLSGVATGYSTADTLMVQIAYGDGTFESTVAKIDSFGTYFAFFSHFYSSSGSYTLQFITTAPDLAADTLVKPNGVVYADSCGNVAGRVYLDKNNDCIFNGNDEPILQRRVVAKHNGNIVASDWTDSSGFYSMEVPIVSTTIDVSFSPINGFNTNCPSSGSYSIISVPSTGNDFALSCNNGFDLYGQAFGGSVPGQIRNMYVSTYNSFCQNQSGTVKIIFDDPLFSYSGTASPAPVSVNGDTVSFNFSNLNNQFYNSFNINLGTYTDTTAQIGDTVCITYMVDPIVGDSFPMNNMQQFCFPVRTSYDPNIKQVQPIGVGNLGKVEPNTELTYTIHFQNTGTFQAYNIYILDTLDDSVLDPSTIQVLGASHPMVVDLISANQNVIKFRFDNINLADSTSNEPASHGWVSYRIQQQPNLANGNTIENSAAIYFDYNPAVITASTLNTIDDFAVSIEEINNSSSNNFAKIYPNPANGILNIEFQLNASSIQVNLYDITGKLIREINSQNDMEQINVSDFHSGIYILELNHPNGQKQLNKVVISR